MAIDLKLPEESAKITVNAFFSPDSLCTAELSLSHSVLESSVFAPIDNGRIVIYQNGNAVDTLTNIGSGKYRSTGFKPAGGSNYDLKITAPEYNEVTSTSYVPSVTPITDVEVYTDPYLSADQDEETKMTITIQDRPGEKNFYLLTIIQIDTIRHLNSPPRVYRVPLRIRANDPLINNSSRTYDIIDGICFNDALFDGKNVTLEVRALYYQTRSEFMKIFYLKTISEDLYKYEMTFGLQDQNSGNPFAQPVNVYNNINNGYGIFAGYSTAVYEYKP